MCTARRFGRGILVLAAIMALALGTRQAFARTPTICDPPLYAGTCDGGTDCDAACQVQNGSEWFGICSGGCCACFL